MNGSTRHRCCTKASHICFAGEGAPFLLFQQADGESCSENRRSLVQQAGQETGTRGGGKRETWQDLAQQQREQGSNGCPNLLLSLLDVPARILRLCCSHVGVRVRGRSGR